ncbi:hypothetical protein J4Q44_G00118620 [Coregonus suidteri]|uniref:Uncharacterized protein n=1 Tax=Coregonus suidteri TaxID=861788 RepID=A0AAN8MMA5_9TELE
MNEVVQAALQLQLSGAWCCCVAWLPRLLAPAKCYATPTDVIFFSAMSLDLSTSPTFHRMRTHSGPSDWSGNRWFGPEPEHVGKVAV